MADDTAQKTASLTSAYLLQPLRTLEQAQQNGQVTQNLPGSGQIERQAPQSSSSDDLAPSQGRDPAPQQSTE